MRKVANFGFLGALVLAAGLTPPAGAVTFTGTLFVSQVSCGVSKSTFTYDSAVPSLTAGAITPVSGCLPGGADGLVFDPVSGNLLVGVNGGGPPELHMVNPMTGALVATIPAGTATPFHVMVDPAGTTAWTSGVPGTPASIPLSPLGTGTAHPLSGDDTLIDTIAWQNQATAFYTSSGIGGFGHFGTINLNTFTTTCVKTASGVCATFPAAHGMSFDPFTGHLFLYGDQHITQINPATLGVVSDRFVPGVNFDQGTTDGLGHLFVANNGGSVFFVDYSVTGMVGAPANFTASIPWPAADDVAPLVGPGAPPPAPVPAPSTLTLMGLGLVGLGWTRRKSREVFEDGVKNNEQAIGCSYPFHGYPGGAPPWRWPSRLPFALREM